jgi:CHASE3 domain sensor protein
MSGNNMSREHPSNKKTVLVLAAVALAFFVAIVLKYWLSK